MFKLSHARAAGLLLVPVLGLVACEAGEGPDFISENNGQTTTTTDNTQLTEQMFLGKWDLDGERTNAANGSPGVDAIPSDIAKDIFGNGWRFKTGGVVETDQAVGWTTGSWKLEGKNTLAVQEKGEMEPKKFSAQFINGFMYLKNANGKTYVYEKDKYFGL
ncbi:MAG TPA: hypothetical protein VG711_07410 [Phycisphaerales bacterium]|nr:hypothetical protein [Phycisphaerales bacterium]